MLSFQPVRTARFTFQLKELTIGDIRALLDINPILVEKARSEFLRLAIKDLTWHKGYENLTLEHLTVQERFFIETTYLSSASDEPDFSVSDGHYSDFLFIEKQYSKSSIELGAMPNDEDIWHIQPLTGAMVEVIEERLLMAERQPERADWVFYAMAAQLYRDTEERVDPYENGMLFGDWLDERVEKLKSLPESAFVSLMFLYFNGLSQLTHLFKMNFDQFGTVVISKEMENLINEKGEKVDTLSARFLSTTCITLPAKNLFGQFDEPN